MAALSATVLALPGIATAAPLYPDLRPLPPTDFTLGTELVNGEFHYVVRLSSFMHNAGQGPLELHGTPRLLTPDGTFDVQQFVYADAGAPTVLPVGAFYFHQAHSHFHFDDFAHFELWSKRGYDRAAAQNFTSGQPLYKSGKISFCLMDSRQIDGQPGGMRRYSNLCSPIEQGISVGWADLYDFRTPGQYVDVGERPLADGDYVVRIIGDPANKLYESPGKADPARESQVANSSAAPLKILNGKIVE